MGGQAQSRNNLAYEIKPTMSRRQRRAQMVNGTARVYAGSRRRSSAGAKRSPQVNYQKRHQKARNTSSWALPVIASMCCVLLVLVFVFALFMRGYGQFRTMRSTVERNAFYPGVTVDGVDVSEMTLNDALNAWGGRDQTARDAYRITLSLNDKEKWTITPEEVGYSSDYESIVKSAWAAGRYGTLSRRFEAVQKLGGAWARDYEVTSGPDRALMHEVLGKVAQAASEPGTQAQITGFDIKNKNFSFEEGKHGLVADLHELTDAVTKQIQAGGGAVAIQRREVEPGHTIETLQTVFGKVAGAKTGAKSSSSNRLTNLRLACEALNGLCIQPGETFSYNDTLGRRTAKRGYKVAPALSSGVHTMELGGGICQVSTTLFNAVAKADLKITRRHPHSIPSAYVARGLDATVNWRNQDFCFKNTSDYPIYLSAGVSKDKQVTVEVWGKKLEEGITIKLKGVTNQTFTAGEPKYEYTNSLPTGETKVIESKRSGYQVSTFRIYYKNDKEIDRERLFKSTYPSFGGIIQVGK